ncbi:MAG TPA: hypothetical protein VEZ26_06475, partial [Sphingomonadaceae bacterium]|nr:hypothetical protein [Sphingomonadaceae bacterium]
MVKELRQTGGGIGSRRLTEGMADGAVGETGLFKPRDQAEAGIETGSVNGPAGVAAQLTHSLILEDPGKLVIARFNSFAERYGQWRERISLHLSGLDLAPDLAEDIGSTRWFRGAGTMFGLAAVAALFWPDFAPVEAASPMSINDAQRDEFRSQMIMPLALGGDSGRHMAA